MRQNRILPEHCKQALRNSYSVLHLLSFCRHVTDYLKMGQVLLLRLPIPTWNVHYHTPSIHNQPFISPEVVVKTTATLCMNYVPMHIPFINSARVHIICDAITDSVYWDAQFGELTYAFAIWNRTRPCGKTKSICDDDYTQACSIFSIFNLGLRTMTLAHCGVCEDINMWQY